MSADREVIEPCFGRLHGRDEELRRLAGLLADPDERLITVTGVAGVGKSHLAHVAAARAERDNGLVRHVVDVAEAADESALWTALGATTRAEAAERIGSDHALILLDNCDPVVHAMASAVSALLRSCPHLMVLVTSRVSLDLRAEVLVVVPPLGTGPGSAAEELFVSLVRPHYRSTVTGTAGRRAVTQICAQADGVPLAIALAAGAVSAQGPFPLLDRLRDGEYPDSGRLRDVPARHRSARQAVAWTDRFLSPADRALLNRLGEYPSSMDIETVRAAAGSAEAFARLDSLLQQSLLVATEGPTGEPAFRVPHLVRAYYRQASVDRPDDPLLPEALFATLAGVLGQEPEADRLTPRQHEIALLVAEGLTNRQIARRLTISEWTVINHMRVVMQKLECPSRVHVVRAMQRQADTARAPAGRVRVTGQ